MFTVFQVSEMEVRLDKREVDRENGNDKGVADSAMVAGELERR